jgi:cation transport regulator ChaC
MPLIFQYGSNCTAARLNGPNRLIVHAADRGRAQTVEDFDITFDVYSQTNGCAAADFIATPGRSTWGVLYEVPEDFIRGEQPGGQRTLEQIEGNRYAPETITVRNEAGEEILATTFLVKPSERREGLWTSAAYVSWIVYGLRAHGVPEEYIAHVIEVALETNRRAIQAAAEQIRLIGTL